MLRLEYAGFQAPGRVNLGCQFFVLLIFKSLQNLVKPFMLSIALLKNEWGILLHAALFLALFAIDLHDLNANLFCWLNRLTLNF